MERLTSWSTEEHTRKCDVAAINSYTYHSASTRWYLHYNKSCRRYSLESKLIRKWDTFIPRTLFWSPKLNNTNNIVWPSDVGSSETWLNNTNNFYSLDLSLRTAFLQTVAISSDCYSKVMFTNLLKMGIHSILFQQTFGRHVPEIHLKLGTHVRYVKCLLTQSWVASDVWLLGYPVNCFGIITCQRLSLAIVVTVYAASCYNEVSTIWCS